MRGVTLVEQVMVVAVLAVLVGIASPSLAGLVRRGRTRSAQADFLEALGFARSEAVLRSTRVLFCPSRDRVHCSDENRWDGGWLVGFDRNHDNQPDAAPLRVGGAHAHLRILSSASRRHVAFLPDGSAAGSNLSLLFCAPGDGREALGLVVSNSGRVRGSRPRGTLAEGCR
ncbi:MAG TPA: GspH/FimT family pseudopilin [Frateuria sp.]|uniref:GspH/FimT family protein n=1 Tax=Frateuria sp. TaxID=2211372 RepID=UPI002D7F42BB|nr:GspH/FimT family pseudopilin [Frateuria sp.]HET6806476.1 GspH/FimT family pseudopilin [Frateuria sp.]